MYLKYQPAFGKIQTQFTGILAGIIGATCYNKFKSVKLPAGALAMYHCANKNKKKVVYGLLLAGSISAFFTGVTEPLEFAFMFLSTRTIFYTCSIKWNFCCNMYSTSCKSRICRLGIKF